MRVVGLSSSVLLDQQDPYNPINRRVSIIVMNRKAEEAASHDGGTVEPANGEASAAPQTEPGASAAGDEATRQPAPGAQAAQGQEHGG
jgi:chemotaxis protein MotB